ncbi:MAG: hypothetical protein J6Y20_08850 [Lachnospiraceae bacterium]|nr:hypothetical protein [Lachnospiraceae bacterium]
MPVRKVKAITLWDLWFFCAGSHVFVKGDDPGARWEYEGGPEGDELLVSNIQAKSYPNYRHVIEVQVYRKEDNDGSI